MTPADKLRELLATRPAMPNTEELFRWWQTSGELLDELLNPPQTPADAWNIELDALAECLIVTCHAMKRGPIPPGPLAIASRLHELAVVLDDTRRMMRAALPGPDGRVIRRG